MTEGVFTGAFAHVVGTFDLAQRKGTIDYVTPVRKATESNDVEDGGIHLIGESDSKQRLFDKVVNPQRNSCVPESNRGTYEEFVPVTPELKCIALMIGNSIVAEFVRGEAPAPAKLAFGAPNPSAPHKVPLQVVAAALPAPGVTYTVQAKRESDAIWQTLALGLPTPTSDVDINQFPGAKAIDVRVLRSDGFSETKIFQDTKTF